MEWFLQAWEEMGGDWEARFVNVATSPATNLYPRAARPRDSHAIREIQPNANPFLLSFSFVPARSVLLLFLVYLPFYLRSLEIEPHEYWWRIVYRQLRRLCQGNFGRGSVRLRWTLERGGRTRRIHAFLL